MGEVTYVEHLMDAEGKSRVSEKYIQIKIILGKPVFVAFRFINHFSLSGIVLSQK